VHVKSLTFGSMHQALRFVYLLLSIILLALPTWAQVPAFNGTIGSAKPATYNDQSQVSSVVVDAAGTTYVTGVFRGSLTLGSTTLTSIGDYDVYVAALDAAGAYRWAVQAGGRQGDSSTSIALDASGNLYVAGYTESLEATFSTFKVRNESYGGSVFIAKLSPAGTWLRVSQAGGVGNNYTYSGGLAVDASGSAYLTGELRGWDIRFGATSVANEGAYNAFVAKLDPTGNWQWAVVEGGDGYDNGSGIALDGSGNIYVTGTFWSTAARFGTTVLQNAGYRGDVFVAKLDARGHWLWAARGGSNLDEGGSAIAVDQAGNAYVTGNVAGESARFGAIVLPKKDISSDLFVGKLSAAGAWQWVVAGGGAVVDSGADITVDATGRATITGSFTGAVRFGALPPLTAVGGADIVVAQLEADGTWRWAAGGGGPGNDYSWALAPTPTGSVQVVGLFEGATLSLGATTLPGGINQNGVYARLGFVTSVADVALRSPNGELTLWPNPSRGTVWGTGFEAGQPVQVFDALGRLVVADARPVYESTGLVLPTLLPGTYILRCGNQARRFVLE
jgi:hypothetical protein